jgi:hypothetical protein
MDISFEGACQLKQAGVAGRVIHGDVSGKVRPGTDFDLVLDIGCYHILNTQEREAYRRNLARWMKPGGAYLLYAHHKSAPADSHGISEDDFAQFSGCMHCQLREDSDERRPDGGGGRPASWALFERGTGLE